MPQVLMPSMSLRFMLEKRHHGLWCIRLLNANPKAERARRYNSYTAEIQQPPRKRRNENIPMQWSFFVQDLEFAERKLCSPELELIRTGFARSGCGRVFLARAVSCEGGALVILSSSKDFETRRRSQGRGSPSMYVGGPLSQPFSSELS